MQGSEPFVRIGLTEIYDKLCAVERDVATLKQAEQGRADAARDRLLHKTLLYTTGATALAGLTTGLAGLVK